MLIPKDFVPDKGIPLEIFCPHCNRLVRYMITSVDDEAEVRGVRFEYKRMIAVCERCFYEIYTPFINDWNIKIREEAYKEVKDG